MIQRYYLSLILYILLGGSNAIAEEMKQLYIGVERNRVPFAYLNSEQEVTGSLVNEINKICKTLNAKCNFMTGEVDTLLEDLRAFKLHGVLLIDSFVIPKIDKIQLTESICKTKPIFIQKRSDTVKTKIEEFKGSIIGVKKGSLLHLYLLENYNSLAQLKPYEQLENAVFDLYSGRIHSLFADNAFFMERVANTSLGKESNPDQLVAQKIGEPEISGKTMTLAFRKGDKEALTSFFLFKIKELQSSPNFPLCDSLSDLTSDSKR